VSLLRGFAVWLNFIGVETVHGILRTLLLVPWVGGFTARQVAVFPRSALIFGGRCIVLLASSAHIHGDARVERAIATTHDVNEPCLAGRSGLWPAVFCLHSDRILGAGLPGRPDDASPPQKTIREVGDEFDRR
jgi:hypothetical protein